LKKQLFQRDSFPFTLLKICTLSFGTLFNIDAHRAPLTDFEGR